MGGQDMQASATVLGQRFFTYIVSLVESEVGQCDIQSPEVRDRSALAALHGER